MYQRTRARLAAGAIGLAMVSAVGMTGSPAYAEDLPGWFTITTGNTSDPSIMLCRYHNQGQGYTNNMCLFTSQDLPTGPDPAVTGNYYPMSQTRLYSLAPGANPGAQANWSNWGAVVHEGSYPWVPPLPSPPGGNANHLWAPTAHEGRDGSYYLYVPDISDATPLGQHTSSHIGVSVAVDARGPYTYQKQITYNGAPIPGYQSDPTVMTTTVTGSTTWIAWANGDFDTCGTFTGARLDDVDMSTLMTAPTEISISGLPASMNSCTPTVGPGAGIPLQHPYMEGPELYSILGLPGGAKFLLVFAVKPTTNPTGCSSNNEAIAYATAVDPLGPFTYGGLIMCGSTTQWTNQASLFAYYNSAAQATSYVLAYHDSPTSGTIPQNRKVHFECMGSPTAFVTRTVGPPGCFNFAWSEILNNPISIR